MEISEICEVLILVSLILNLARYKPTGLPRGVFKTVSRISGRTVLRNNPIMSEKVLSTPPIPVILTNFVFCV